MRKTNIGGEALIEGVMMRGPESVAIAIRKPDGEILVDKKPTQSLSKKYKFVKIPVIRGAVGLFESMVLGMKSLMYSAEFVDIEGDSDEEPSKFEKFLEKVLGDKFQDIMIYVSVAIALVFGLGLFMLLPNLLAELIQFNTTTKSGLAFYNIFEGVIRIGLFVGYIVLISKLKDIRRVFEYHGAEHKTIHCYEHEEELTVENVKKYTTRHPRCGTAFLFVVMILSIIVFSMVGRHSISFTIASVVIRIPTIVFNLLSRIILIPLIAGLSYEVIKFAGRSDWKIMKVVSAPGLALQRFTTREPDDRQIEVAIAALNNVLVDSKGADKW